MNKVKHSFFKFIVMFSDVFDVIMSLTNYFPAHSPHVRRDAVLVYVVSSTVLSFPCSPCSSVRCFRAVMSAECTEEECAELANYGYYPLFAKQLRQPG